MVEAAAAGQTHRYAICISMVLVWWSDGDGLWRCDIRSNPIVRMRLSWVWLPLAFPAIGLKHASCNKIELDRRGQEPAHRAGDAATRQPKFLGAGDRVEVPGKRVGFQDHPAVNVAGVWCRAQRHPAAAFDLFRYRRRSPPTPPDRAAYPPSAQQPCADAEMGRQGGRRHL